MFRFWVSHECKQIRYIGVCDPASLFVNLARTYLHIYELQGPGSLLQQATHRYYCLAVDDCSYQADYQEQAGSQLEVISAAALHAAVSDPLGGSVPSLVAEWNSVQMRADALAAVSYVLTNVSCT